MRLDTDTYHDGGIDRHDHDAEPDEPVGFDMEDTILDAETRATLGAATATAPDFSGRRIVYEFRMSLDTPTLVYCAAWVRARRRAKDFSKAINDLQRGAVPTARAEAQEGGGILPAAPGERES